MVTVVDVYQKALIQAKSEFSDFKITYKSSSLLMKIINILLIIITFGQMKKFMTGFVTTIGHTVYVPDTWSNRDPYSKSATLLHELVHMRQEKKLGSIRYKLTYLFWPFPVLFAKGRENLEKEAYEVSIRTNAQYYGKSYVASEKYKNHIINHFVSAEYFWITLNRKSIEKWYDKIISTL